MAEVKKLSSRAEYNLLDRVLDLYKDAEKSIRIDDIDSVANKLYESQDSSKPLSVEEIKKAIGYAETLTPGATVVASLKAVLADDSKIFKESLAAFETEEKTKVPSDILPSKRAYVDIYRVVESYDVIVKNPGEFGYVPGKTTDDELAQIIHNNYTNLPIGYPMSVKEIKEAFANAKRIMPDESLYDVLHKMKSNPDNLSNAYRKFKERNEAETKAHTEKYEDAIRDYRASQKVNRRAKRTKFWSVFGRIAMALLVPAVAIGLFSGAAVLAGGVAALAGAGAIGIVTLTAVTAFLGYKLFKGAFVKTWGKLREAWAKADGLLLGNERGSEKHLENCKNNVKQLERDLSNDRAKNAHSYSMEEDLFYLWDNGINPNSPKDIRELARNERVARTAESTKTYTTGSEEKSATGEHEIGKGKGPAPTTISVSELHDEISEDLKARAARYESVRARYESVTKTYTTDYELARARDAVIDGYVQEKINEFESTHPGSKISNDEVLRLTYQARAAFDNYVTADINAVKNPEHANHASAVQKIDVVNENFEYRYGDATASESLQFDGEEMANRVNAKVKDLAEKHRVEFVDRKEARTRIGIVGDKEKQRYFYHLAARELLSKGCSIRKDGKIVFNAGAKRNSFNEAFVEDQNLQKAVLDAVDKYFFSPVGDKEFLSDPLEVKYTDKDGKVQTYLVPMDKINAVAEFIQSDKGKKAGYKHYSERYNELKYNELKPEAEDGLSEKNRLWTIATNYVIEKYYPNYETMDDKAKVAATREIAKIAGMTMDLIYGRLDGVDLQEHEANFNEIDRYMDPIGPDYKAIIDEVVRVRNKVNERLDTMGAAQNWFGSSYGKFTDAEKGVVNNVIAKIAKKNGVDLNELNNYLQSVEDKRNHIVIVVHTEDGKSLSDEELRKIAAEVSTELLGVRQKWDAHLQEQENVRELRPDFVYNQAKQSLVNDKFVERVIDEMVDELVAGRKLTDEQKERIKQARADLKRYYTDKNLYLDKDMEIPSIEKIVEGVPGLEGQNINAVLKEKINDKVDKFFKFARKRRSDQQRFNAVKGTLGAMAKSGRREELGTFEALEATGGISGWHIPGALVKKNILHSDIGYANGEGKHWTAENHGRDNWRAGIQKDGYYGAGHQIKSDRDVVNEINEMMESYANGNNPTDIPHTDIEEVEFVAHVNVVLENPTPENLQKFREYVDTLSPELQGRFKNVANRIAAESQKVINAKAKVAADAEAARTEAEVDKIVSKYQANIDKITTEEEYNEVERQIAKKIKSVRNAEAVARINKLLENKRRELGIGASEKESE